MTLRRMRHANQGWNNSRLKFWSQQEGGEKDGERSALFSWTSLHLHIFGPQPGKVASYFFFYIDLNAQNHNPDPHLNQNHNPDSSIAAFLLAHSGLLPLLDLGEVFLLHSQPLISSLPAS